MSTNGLGNINFGIRASDYIQQPIELKLGQNMNDYANTYGSYTNIDGAVGDTDTDIGGGFMDWMGTDSAKNTIGLGSLGLGVFNIFNTRSAQKQAKRMWEAENARANELMAMNKEKYETYKADKAKLNSQYI